MQAAKTKYGTAIQFLECFNPAKQIELCEDYLDQCFTGKVPTLRGLSQIYDREMTNDWIGIQINDLMLYAGVKEKLSIAQIESLASVIRSEFFYLKITELMVFFHWFKSGRYGKFYGAVDGLVITSALQEFLDDRREKMRQIEQKRKEKSKHAARAERQEMEKKGLLLARDEWEEVSWLFNM